MHQSDMSAHPEMEHRVQIALPYENEDAELMGLGS
jgi:hypothetical protein